MSKIALALYVDGEISRFAIQDDELEVLQGIVGGWVQCIGLRPDLTLWCNDDGKLMQLPHNPLAQAVWDKYIGQGTDVIVGNVVLLGGVDEEGETLGIGQDLAGLITSMLIDE